MEQRIQKIQESYDVIQLMEFWSDIEEEYTRDICYSLCDLEKEYREWYMDGCHLSKDNYFQLLFDDSTSSHEESIVKESHELVITTNFSLHILHW